MNGSETELLNAIKEFQEEKWKNHDLRADNLADKVEKNTEVAHETQRMVLSHLSGLPCKTHSTKIWFHFWLITAAFSLLGFILLR